MIEQAQQKLREAAQKLGHASSEARGWVNRLAETATSVATEQQSLVETTRRAENLSRKLAASSGRRNSAGVFGPSQAGKSYLVSVLARNQKSESPLTADFAGQKKNFIAEINPPGDRESTGLVTRFTIVPGTTDSTHPVELRMLTETDLVKILSNSFLSDFDLNNRKETLKSEEDIRATIHSVQGHVGTAAPHLDEIAMFDIGEYFHSYFRKTAYEPLERAGFWEALTQFGWRLPIVQRVRLYSVLWGDTKDFTDLFLTLQSAMEQLQHSPTARADLSALTPRDDSIIDVQILVRRLNTPEDARDLISVLPEQPLPGRAATPVKIRRAVLTALVAEIKVVITEKPWDFFEHTDLLDFPGARSREKQIELPKDPIERDDRVRNMLLRGKIAYLFQRYTEERELTCMLLCMPPSTQEVKDLAGMVRGWVDQTHGTTPEQRRSIACALFLVLTKFDMDFIEKDGDTSESRYRKFNRRLEASFLALYGADQWVQDWDGQPFNNGYFLRNPGLKQPHIVQYGETRTRDDGSEQRIEAAILKEAVPRLAEYRAGFLQDSDCQKHFRNMEAVWDEAFRLNDGGVAYLVDNLERVLSPALKTRQLTGRLVDQAVQLRERLKRFYRSDGDASRKEKEEALVSLRRRLFKACSDRGFVNFTQFLSRIKLPDADVRAAFLNVANLKIEPVAAEASHSPAAEVDPWDDPWDAPAGGDQPKKAAAPAPVVQTRDRSYLFATQVLNLWTERVRGLSTEAHALVALGMDAQLAGDLGNELVTAAHRHQLVERIAEQVRSQLVAANVRWDEVADRGASIACIVVNDFVAYLGFGDLPEAERPAVKGVHAFAAPPVPVRGALPALGNRPAALNNEYFMGWGAALLQMGLDNVSFSGGREINEDDNRALGVIMTEIAPAATLTVG